MRSVMQYWEPERPLEPKDYDLPVCPVCGEETDTYYKNKDGVIVGAVGVSGGSVAEDTNVAKAGVAAFK